MSHHRASLLIALAVVPATVAVACGKEDPRKNPFDPPASATQPAPKLSAAPTPKGPPQIQIDEFGPKVGYEVVLIEKKDGAERLTKAIDGVKAEYEGKELDVNVHRKAKTPWVSALLAELDRIGVTAVNVNTETRPEFSSKLRFIPQSKATDAASCSLVMMVLEDRATAVWKLAGGTASRRAKGFAGPDLSTTAETIERRGKACSDSSTYFVSADPQIEWGLTYDLAASAQKVPGVKLDRVVLLREAPVAGRVVKLK